MKSSITTLTLSISVLCFVLLSSCSEESANEHSDEHASEHSDEHSSEPSDARVTAIAIHDDSGRLAKEFRAKLASQFQLATTTEPTDSAFLKEIVILDARFKVWSKTLVKLPGTVCNHEEGEHHHHDHAAEALLEELSDEELLDLQKAIHDEIMELIEDLDVLVSSK
jgi:hypothetical protein